MHRDDFALEPPPPHLRLVTWPGRERLGGHDTVTGVTAQMLQHTQLVRGERLVRRGPQPNVEDLRPAPLDLDDVPRGEIDERCRDGLLRDAKVVDEEVRNGGRLGTELERPGPMGGSAGRRFR